MNIDLRPHAVVTRRPLGDLPSTLSMAADSHLSEDFILSDEIEVDVLAGTSSVAAFVNPANGRSEALIIQNGELFYVCREPLSDSGWNFFGLGAGFPAIAPLNSAGGWAFADDGSVWQNVAGRWNAPGSGPIVTAAFTGTDGTIWGSIGGNLQVFDPATMQWSDPPIPGNMSVPGASVPSGSLENLWYAVSGAYPEVAYYNGQGWQSILPLVPADGSTQIIEILVGFTDGVWALTNAQTVYLYNPATEELTNPWQYLPTNHGVFDLAAISATEFWAIADSGLCYVTINEQFEPHFQTVEGPFQLSGGPFSASIALGTDQTLWLTDTYGTVWKYQPTAPVTWQRQMMPPAVSGTTAGWSVADVVAIVDSAGTVHAYFTRGGTAGIWQTTLSNGDWQPPSLLSVSGAESTTRYGRLGIARDATTGDIVLHAASDSGRLMVAAGVHGPASGTLYGPSSGIDALCDTVVAFDGASWIFFATEKQLLVGASLAPASWSFSGWQRFSGSPQVSALVPLADPTQGAVLVLDNDTQGKNLWSASASWPLGGGFTQLSGGSGSVLSAITAVAVTLDSLSGLQDVWAIDSSELLWLMRQTAPAPSLSWTSWHPMGDPCSVLAGGAGTAGVPELYFVDTGLTAAAPSLNQLLQNPVSLNWTTQPVIKPQQALDTPTAVATYVTQITVTNPALTNAPVPVSGVPVSVSTVEPVIMTVEGQQYEIAPGQPQTFTTDAFGRVALTTIALGLHTANLTVSAPGAPTLEVYPPALAQATLGSATASDLTSAQCTTATVPVLQQAPLVQANASNAADVVKAIQGVFNVQQSKAITPNTTGPDQPMNLAPSYAQARAFSAAKLVSHRPLRGPRHDPDNLEALGGFWDDLLHFAEDIFHAIRTAFITVENIITDVENGLVELWIAIENGAAQAVTYVIDTIDDVAHAIESAFQWLAAKVEMVIDWLKELFDWGDIVNTGKVLAHYVTQFFSAVASYITPAGSSPLQELIDSKIQEWTTQINTALGTLAGNSQPLSQMIPPQYASMQPPTPVQGAQSANQSRTNFAHRHAQNYVQNGGILAASGGTPSQLAGLQTVATTVQTNHAALIQGFAGNLQNTFAQPASMTDSLVSDLIALVQDVVTAVMTLAQDAADALLDIAADALSAFQGLLETELDIPILSWLFEQLTGEPLTLLNLMALLFALPATIIYKVVNDGAAPYDPATVATILATTWTFPPIGDGLARLDISPVTDGFAGFAMIVTLILYAIVDALGDTISVLVPDPGPLGTFVSVISLFLTVGALVWEAPWNQFSAGPSNWSGADVLYVSIWGAGCLLWAADIAFFALGFGKEMAKLSGPLGQVMVGMGGFVMLGLGAAFIAADQQGESQYGGTYYAAAMISPWSSMQKMIYPALTDNPSTPLALICAGIDLICDVATGVLTFVEDSA